jgi:hypothetical protein
VETEKEETAAPDMARQGEEGSRPGAGMEFEAVEIMGREEVRGENRGVVKAVL